MKRCDRGVLVKCEMNDCKHNVTCLQGSVCNKDRITIGYGNRNGVWVFAECMNYVKN